jgi:hypothetical protein
MALVLLVAAAIVFLRSTPSQPQLEANNQTGPDVLRSGSFSILSPVGDLQNRPNEISWGPVSTAKNYQVRVLEVDHRELWRADTAEDHIELPTAVRVRIVPAKTLFVEITAFDVTGNQVGSTGLVSFRLMPKTGVAPGPKEQ